MASPSPCQHQCAGHGPCALGLPWPCVHEFLAIVAHPRIYDPPSTTAQATAQIDAWLKSPVSTLLAESKSHWATLKRELSAGKVVGPMVHDASVAAMCLAHGVTEFWTADRDFSRFPTLAARNPLLGRSLAERPAALFVHLDGTAPSAGVRIAWPRSTSTFPCLNPFFVRASVRTTGLTEQVLDCRS